MFDQPGMVEICTWQQCLQDLFQKRNWGLLVSAQISLYYLPLNMQRYWDWNIQVLKHLNPKSWRLHTTQQSELPWVNELLVTRPVLITDHTDTWKLLHLQDKTCWQINYFQGFKFCCSAPAQPAYSGGAIAVAELVLVTCLPLLKHLP